MSKYLFDIQNDFVQLEVYECTCGFHIALDAPYLEQVDEISIKCPSCEEILNTAELNPQDDMPPFQIIVKERKKDIDG